MNTQNKKKMRQCWIGLAHVKPRAGNNLLNGAIGAFVPILAIAKGINDFISIATNWMESYDFDVIEIQDIEMFRDRICKSDVDDELKQLSENLTEQDPVAIDAFQAYDSE
jgi:hypothetical protein